MDTIDNERILITESNLHDGEITLNGYKHAMVQIISASVAANTPVLITNVPLVDDTYVIKKILERCGCLVTIKDHTLFIDPRNMSASAIDPLLSKEIHGSLYLMPAFALRFGGYLFKEAGGCQIGSVESENQRPTSQIFDVMSKFGIETKFKNSSAHGVRTKSIDTVELDIMEYSDNAEYISGPEISSATKTAIICSLGVKRTKIHNPYLKTDVQDLLRFIANLGYGVNIETHYIEIFAPNIKKIISSIEFTLTECVSEAITYITLAVLKNINLTINLKNLPQLNKGLETEFGLLKKIGVSIFLNNSSIQIYKNSKIDNTNIDVTHEGIQSDHHPFFVLILLMAKSSSVIREFVWKDRFAYVDQLKKLGARLDRDNNKLTIIPSKLINANQCLIASDTRAAAVLILASLLVPGSTVVMNAQHLHRGYENIIPSIQSLGGKISIEGRPTIEAKSA